MIPKFRLLGPRSKEDLASEVGFGAQWIATKFYQHCFSTMPARHALYTMASQICGLPPLKLTKQGVAPSLNRDTQPCCKTLGVPGGGGGLEGIWPGPKKYIAFSKGPQRETRNYLVDCYGNTELGRAEH